VPNTFRFFLRKGGTGFKLRLHYFRKCPETCGNTLLSPFLLHAPLLANILFSNHDSSSANGTFPWIKPEHRIDLDLEKTLSREPPQRIAACLAMHLISPANQFCISRHPHPIWRPSERLSETA
jgi:hypothetical protein